MYVPIIICLQKQKKDEDVESILNLFSEQKSLLVAKRPQFGKATVMQYKFDLKTYCKITVV